VQKPETAAPKAGDELDGAIETREYEAQGEKRTALKFKKTQGFGGGRGGGGRAWKPRPDDSPVVYAGRQASIQRQHSQDMAMRIVELAASSNQSVDDVCSALGLPEKDGDGNKLDLIDRVSFDVNVVTRAAWQREAEHGNIAKEMAKIGG
jgi:hypothetical protein